MLERKFGKFLIVKSINFYLIRYFPRKKRNRPFPKMERTGIYEQINLLR